MISLWERAYIISAAEGEGVWKLELLTGVGEGGLGLAEVRKND